MKRRIPIIIGLIVVLTFALAACGGGKGAQGGGSPAGSATASLGGSSGGSAKLAAAVEAAIDTMYFDGSMKELANKDFGDDFTAGLRDVKEQPTIPKDFTTIKQGTLMVGLECGYPPMEYFDTDGTTMVGFDIDVANKLGELLGLKVEFVDTAWDGIFAGLDKGLYDCIISSVSITPERQQNYILTEPYVSNRLCLVTYAGNGGTGAGVKSPDDFPGHTIAVQVATTAADSVDKMIKDGAKNIEVGRYEKVTQCFDELKLGRVDAVYVDSVVASYYTKDNAEYQRVWMNDVGEPMGICFARK